jgi:outer membrane lipoprotein-sorting protein
MRKSNIFLPAGRILRCIFVGLFFLLNLMVVPSLAVEPEKILCLSLEAQFQVNIEGIKETQVYRQERNYTIRAKVVYQEPDFSYILYLAPPMVKGKKILDNGKLRIEYSSGMNDFKISASLNSSLARKRREKGLNLIFANHTISQSPDEEIAGRGVYVISLLLQSSGNPGLKRWIDKETFLPLKQERRSSEGKLTFSFQFLEIHFNKKLSREELNDIPKSVKDNGFRPPYRIIGDIEELKEISRFSLSFPRYLPSGYSFEEGVLLNGGKKVALTYSNGLETIVLWQSLPLNIKIQDDREMPFGTKFWTEKGKTFVLIANISEEELTKIMESVE